MTIIQLAKLLQLAGFLLAGIFGGILLDELVGGKIAKRFTSMFVGFVDRLRKFMQKLAKDIIRAEEPEEPVPWRFIVAFFFFWSGSLTVLIIGWLKHISVLLWIGVSLYSLYAMSHLVGIALIMFVPRIKAMFPRIRAVRKARGLPARESLQEYAQITALGLSGIGPLALLALLFLPYLLKVSSSTMKILANPRVPKVAFTVLGFVMLLAGLIIDAVAAF